MAWSPVRTNSWPSCEQTLADAVTVHHGHMPEITLTSSTTASGIWALHDEIVWPDGTRMRGDGHYHETYERWWTGSGALRPRR